MDHLFGDLGDDGTECDDN